MNGVQYRVFPFFLQEFFRILTSLCFTIKLLSNIVHVPVNNGIYKFAKLLFDLACRLAMAIIYNHVFEHISQSNNNYCTISIPFKP